MSDRRAEGAGTHPVDEVLPPGRLAVLRFHHVLAMYAGAVAVPLILGGGEDGLDPTSVATARTSEDTRGPV